MVLGPETQIWNSVRFIHSAFPFAESITALNSIDIPQIGLTLFFSLYSLDDAVLVASGMV